MSRQPSREEKLIAGTCTRPWCNDLAGDRGEECPRHHERTKARKAKYMKRRRAEWIRRKRCEDCGRKRKGQARLCARCLMRFGRLIQKVDNYVDKSSRISARTVIDKEGRTRFLGQKRRGAPSIGQTDEFDLVLARKELQHAEEGHAYYQSAAVKAMPRIQREDVRQAYLGRMFAVARTCLAACARGGWTIPGLTEADPDDDEIAASPRKSGR